MQGDHLKAAFRCVRHTVLRIQAGGARLRHNRAIKEACFLLPVAPQFQPSQHGLVPALGVVIAYRPWDRVRPRHGEEGTLRPLSISHAAAKLGNMRMMRRLLDTRKSIDATTAGGRWGRTLWARWALCAAAISLVACAETVTKHGHQFQENDLKSITS